MNKKQKAKKGNWVDRVSGIVLIAFAVGVVVILLFIVKGRIEEKKEKEAAERPQSTVFQATEEPPADEADITRYKCVISREEKDQDGSEFCLEFNEKTGTYKEFLNAGTSSSEMDSGTFTKTKDYIRIVNKKNNENVLLYEDSYLVSQNALYKGKVPKRKTFTKTFIQEVSNVSKIEIKFSKDGTFSQKIVRYSGKQDKTGKTNSIEGTYERKGRFIMRKRKTGEDLMPFYVYHDTLCTSYYKKA